MSDPRNGKPSEPYAVPDVKLPPNDPAAEKELLAICLRDNAQIPEAQRLITAGEFWVFAHRKIFEAVLSIADKGKPVNAVSVGAWLKAAKVLDDVGASYIAELAVAPRTGSVESCCEVIRNCATLRDLERVGKEIALRGMSPTGSPAEMLQEAEQLVLEIADRSVVGETVDVGTALREAYDLIDSRRKNDGQGSGLPTSFADLDALMVGMQDGNLITLAARPSVGKSALSLAIAAHVAVDLGQPTLFVSLEQSRTEVAERLICMRGRIDSWRLRKGTLTADEISTITDTGAMLSEAPLFIDHTGGQRMFQIAANARRYKLKSGLRFLVVDYLQFIDPDDLRVSRQEQVSAISRRLKNLAKELSIPVLACAQLNRQVEGRADSRPRLSDIRESGAVEQDSDVVIMLHRPSENSVGYFDGLIEVGVEKNRNGPTGELKLFYEKKNMLFQNYARPFAPNAQPFRGGEE